MRKKYIILTLVLTTAFAGFFARAQVRDTDIVLSISPQYPSQNQSVNATLNSHSINLDKANIFWSVNDQETSGGIGKKSFSFKTEDTGSFTVLSVTIDTVDGQSISKTMTITPAELDMLWEAYDSYTPPFYKGKALVTSQGTLKIVAVPSIINQNGKVNINNLSYVWKKDSKTQSDSSGWGKNYFIFQNSYLDKGNIIEVKVSDISGGASTSGKITLNTTNPKILFYQNDPALGVKWERTLNNGFTINPNGETLTVEPYFFSPQNLNSADLVFDWSLNGEKIQTPSPKNILSIKPEAGQSGSATIKVVVNNIRTLFQSIEKQINVRF
ncbi:MAG: hypothetical protein UR62_C0009G0007 [Candidatus Nomurabacteria bacterium GW2011_GWF2_35_12]|uniref:PKD domain-containing protein n=3 Tax=Candidatus Nomuraibacteriota TaxID=1752729 RepID=A0A0G0DXJ7_9BACT|nr:MAG: hypothetical protein UR62_C0009G0007 [Candidatus Nomurabacteria bacterium GW2011_GWF2_35_12]KKP72789.1 MAG: hypothetical protein UR70_C0004G0032 [Candidatus Nomurabacteria bacterium GW2011_GWB1_35_20]KKP75520.1 MAG: hypothetical protein UR72_C0005G0037 [Parcubacteria group bacterium GW2011_GWC1_35_21]KKP78012.1 MAG: hypothetical protein UR77_C0008G0007 [Candidatus Nomurabacteria bacterium GW2011_GWC2_35_35]KKP85432.1 MAG: hypothetical protein UR86_C0003G0002 [Parcubacteria group bacteri